MRRSRETELRHGLLAEFKMSGTKKSFYAWVVEQAAAGDSEADEYLGLVNQK